MATNITLVGAAGIMSLIIIGASAFLIGKVASGFYASSVDWLLIGLLLWLIFIQWFKAQKDDLEDKK